VDQPGGEQPAGHLPHPDPGLRADGSADGVRAALVAAVDVAPQGERLPRPERVVVGEVVRDVEGQRDRVVAQPLDVGDAQGVECRAAADH
jgi:hypothetical protein